MKEGMEKKPGGVKKRNGTADDAIMRNPSSIRKTSFQLSFSSMDED